VYQGAASALRVNKSGKAAAPTPQEPPCVMTFPSLS